ncbi:MAG: hypothetical protein AVDCRST_MAG73-698 [uncultured Thermomicrobiales bacterium]|uniref:Nucleoside ABC transporter, permease protein 2 n=1 Tax=uncultured Thermomicrobiales bacterium TaxID=1645740 RepID=A0A6J4TN36_9BACT|nr:MAG: hypothetical protein AVDCRST_MAG73-698 [uncultured Thermomicrobiales bacterium]
MTDLPVADFLSALLGSGLLLAVPLLLAALGEAFAERAGLLNLGIEGMMLGGAFAGFAVALETGRIAAGVAAGAALGVALGSGFGLLTIWLRVDQVLTGLAITILGSGLTGFLYRDLYGGQNRPLPTTAARLDLPVLTDVPVVGRALFGQPLLVYLAWAAVPIAALVLGRTRFGLAVRAVGEAPFAADAAGIGVAQTRFAAILIGGAAAGLGGAFLAVVDVRTFTDNMTLGQGFLALALTMLGRWRPWRILAGALLFGMLRSLETGLPILGMDVRPEFVGMLPYLGLLAALVVLARRAAMPAALGVPYERGRR